MADTASVETQEIPAALAEFGVSPDELMAAINLLRQGKAEKDAKDAAARAQRETGYPKPLYNAMYPGESVLIPGTTNRLSFHKGKIEVRSAEEEATIRGACKNRVYEKDLKEEKVCPRCHNFVSGSSEALQTHIERFHMP